jgi:hypothetical protein
LLEDPLQEKITSIIDYEFVRVYDALSGISDGTFSSRPFEDMEPFLSRDEFKKEMIIDII